MLELILTRRAEHSTIVQHAENLKFMVLDELHTYRGRQGADVSMLMRRARQAFNSPRMQCVGTSATLASGGSFEEQRVEIAKVASELFGAKFKPENIIGETLRRGTAEIEFSQPSAIEFLRRSLTSPDLPSSYEEFIEHPLAAWIESEIGITTDPDSNRLKRAEPRPLLGINSLSEKLSHQTGLPIGDCAEKIKQILMIGYNTNDPENDFHVFAFRLHQFISRGDTVYASLESPATRYPTVHGQRFVPGSRKKILLPMAFCRECGQEYFTVAKIKDRESEQIAFVPRVVSEMKVETGEAGFLYISDTKPWPTEDSIDTSLLPEDWVEESGDQLVIKRNNRKHLPKNYRIDLLGNVVDSSHDQLATYLSAPFRFCLNCGVSYNNNRTDFGKLSGLSSGGRSTDTTLLTLSTIRILRKSADLEKEARKLLSFTDNRQDASLQAGHFNDFVEMATLRAAIYTAILNSGVDGLEYDQISNKVFEIMEIPAKDFASDPNLRFGALADAQNILVVSNF